MVLMEAIGLAAAEVFDYNRENFEQDQEQRIKRDLQRVEMQITRFDLFRQDIEDLYKLTVDKMDMYHLVGALFLAFTTTFYTVGRIREAVVPPFYLGAYFLSVASALCYLLLAVWLSMHASISSHSFGVRLRTRYVRLPIPSASQLAGLAAKLADFEKTGVMNVLRAPFSGAAGRAYRGAVPEDPRGGTEMTTEALRGQQVDIHGEELLGEGLPGLEQEKVLVSAAVNSPGRHVQMFRKLQSKWQCFDAYARVCMALGVNYIAESVQMYLFGILLLQRRSITTAIAVMVVFQSASLGLLVLDISGLRRWLICCVQLIRSLPVIGVCCSLCLAPRDDTHAVELDNEYPLAPIAFALQAVSLELMLYLARPTGDEASLPRRFRSVLFLDVFGDAAYDPTEAETDGGESRRRDVGREACTAAAERALVLAWTALRRLEAVPARHFSGDQRSTLTRLRSDLVMWRQMLARSAEVNGGGKRGRATSSIDDGLTELRSWARLTRAERAADPFARCLVGPLQGFSEPGRLYDLENEKVIEKGPDGQGVLSIDEAAELLKLAEDAVRRVVGADEWSSPGTARGRFGPGAQSGSTLEGSTSTGSAVVRRSADGKSVRFTKVDRMPWSTTRRLTRMLQFCWLLLAVLQALQLRYFGVFRIDYPLPQAERRRRLSDAAPAATPTAPLGASGGEVATMALERVVVDAWPHGSYSEPVSVTCLPDSSGVVVGVGQLLYAAHPADDEERQRPPSGRPLRLQRRPLPRHRFPSGAVPLCASSAGTVASGASDLCLFGTLTAGGRGVALWRFGASTASDGTGGDASVVLPIQGGGPAWRRFAGAVFRCGELEASLLPRTAPAVVRDDWGRSGEWCLLLAGWDGQRLPVAVVRLPGAPSEPPARGAQVAAYFDLPLPPAAAPPPAAKSPAAPGAAAVAPLSRRSAARSRRRLAASSAAVGGREQGTVCAAAVAARRGSTEAARANVSAMHLDPGSGRLWAALEDGTSLQAWDLKALRSLGRWAPQGARRILALCERGTAGRAEGASELLLVASPDGAAAATPADAELPGSNRALFKAQLRWPSEADDSSAAAAGAAA
eukprot:TRINITY_DN21492_c0_g1_i1.p1 TRINITY_DN21492_c0_g1~~TRINITY_DN21492_c0_g1_i1.p1  ORF type:complete len:1106 (+),score=213.40 TRINITY_DN21492_c0_g1_i1:79-3318(+)